jgi:hypothetical protein
MMSVYVSCDKAIAARGVVRGAESGDVRQWARTPRGECDQLT